MIKVVVCILSITFASFQLAIAQAEEVASSEAVLIVYKQQPTPQLVSHAELTDTISIVYKPADFLETQLTPADKGEVSNLADDSSYSANDLKTFVNKKNQFLKSIKIVMRFLKIPIRKQILIIETLNNQIYKNKNILIASNTKVVSVQLGFALGVGAQASFLNSLRKNKILSFLPVDVNYFFASSLGFSIVRTNINDKFHYSIEGVYEAKKAIKTLSPFVIAKAGLALSYAIENREKPELYETTQLLKISALNLETSNQVIRFSVLAGPSLVPGGALVAGIEGVTRRVNLNYATLKQDLIHKYKSFFKIKTQCTDLIESIR